MSGTDAPPAGGIPTASAVDHVGFNVPDLDQAIAFFTEVLGFTLLVRAGDVSAGTRVALLDFGGTGVELLQFRRTDQAGPAPGLEEHWGYHLALTIGDLDAAVAYLGAQAGVRLLREPDQTPSGRRRALFLTPWGATVQLITPRVSAAF